VDQGTQEEVVEEECIENKVGFCMLFKDKVWQDNNPAVRYGG